MSDAREGIIDPPRRGANIIEHVFDGPENLTEGLLRRGYTEGQARKILGENFLRVLEEQG